MNTADIARLKFALSILDFHQRWRRDDDGEAAMQDPKVIGQAIDVILLLVPGLLEEKG